jgi:hypothetical protein
MANGEASVEPSPPPHPHFDHKETGALCYSLLTRNNSGLSIGKLVETDFEVLEFYSSCAHYTPSLPLSPRGSLLSIHSM